MDIGPENGDWIEPDPPSVSMIKKMSPNGLNVVSELMLSRAGPEFEQAYREFDEIAILNNGVQVEKKARPVRDQIARAARFIGEGMPGVVLELGFMTSRGHVEFHGFVKNLGSMFDESAPDKFSDL